ncbi:hypothetical protein [Virgibacillus phage Mimir87]|nr:hypothetical protein [Virgibacillus phage Mimir87]
MKLAVQEVYNLTEGLNEIINKELSAVTGLKIHRNHKKLVEEFKSADEVRKKLVEKYKEKDLEDGGVRLKKDKIEDFQKELDDLMKQEVEIKLSPIMLSELKKNRY